MIKRVSQTHLYLGSIWYNSYVAIKKVSKNLHPLKGMFPGASSDIGSDKFEPAYYLLDKHRFSNFEVRLFRFNFTF